MMFLLHKEPRNKYTTSMDFFIFWVRRGREGSTVMSENKNLGIIKGWADDHNLPRMFIIILLYLKTSTVATAAFGCINSICLKLQSNFIYNKQLKLPKQVQCYHIRLYWYFEWKQTMCHFLTLQGHNFFRLTPLMWIWWHDKFLKDTTRESGDVKSS